MPCCYARPAYAVQHVRQARRNGPTGLERTGGAPPIQTSPSSERAPTICGRFRSLDSRLYYRRPRNRIVCQDGRGPWRRHRDLVKDGSLNHLQLAVEVARHLLLAGHELTNAARHLLLAGQELINAARYLLPTGGDVNGEASC